MEAADEVVVSRVDVVKCTDLVDIPAITVTLAQRSALHRPLYCTPLSSVHRHQNLLYITPGDTFAFCSEFHRGVIYAGTYDTFRKHVYVNKSNGDEKYGAERGQRKGT